MAKGYRMDTPKGAVQFVYDQHGVDAARHKAKDLGVEKKVERWLDDWQSKKRVPSPKGAGDVRRRVREVGFPKERKGTVVVEGEQVSTVRWDNGDVRHVGNEYLITQVKKEKRNASEDEDREPRERPKAGHGRKARG